MKWYEVTNADSIPSPALLIFPQRIRSNIDKMIAIAGSAGRLRPHIKTHKLPQVVDMQIAKGISKFKCATIAEAEMLAEQKAPDILLAMQPVGPHATRLFSLIQKYPGSTFSCLVDSTEIADTLAKKANSLNITLPVWIDINNGMNRTGILPDEEALELYKFINEHPHLKATGLHVYDGHIRISNLAERKSACDKDFESVLSFVEKIKDNGMPVPDIIAGGSPTFPIHTQRKSVDLSPGTVLLWDEGYGDKFPDMDFFHAAVLMCRIVSKPQPNLLCLDLGHKAIAAEMPAPRLRFLNLEHTTMTMHSEEHLVIETDKPNTLKAGDVVYGIPMHICPTVDRHETVFVVEENFVKEEWPVVSRKRKITI